MPSFNDKLMNGPIPGENYTTDTKNFPWHRPPQFTNLDDAIEYSVKFIMDEERSDNYIIMLQIGWSVVDMSQMFIMNGISKGLWTFDMGLLLAGPIAHILVIMARGADIEYDLGVEKTDKGPSLEYFRALAKENPQIVEAMSEVIDPSDDNEEPDENAGGPTPPEDVATQPPSAAPAGGLGGMQPPPSGGGLGTPQPAPQEPNPTAGAPADQSEGVM